MAFLWKSSPKSAAAREAPPTRRIPGIFGMESETDGFISTLLATTTVTGYFFSAHGINFPLKMLISCYGHKRGENVSDKPL